MTAKPRTQQRTHLIEEPTGAPSDDVVLVPLSAAVLEVARQRSLERYVQAICDNHRIGPGVLGDLFADMIALAKTRPML